MTLCCQFALFAFVDNTVPSNHDTSTPVSGYRPVHGTSKLATLCVCHNQAAVKGLLACKTDYTVCLCARLRPRVSPVILGGERAEVMLKGSQGGHSLPAGLTHPPHLHRDRQMLMTMARGA